MEALQSFTGKRNAVVTLFVPGDANIGKTLDGIEGRVKAIKHANKKGQIMQVLKCIRERTADRKVFGGNGCVVCCGLPTDGDKIFYEEVVPPHAPVEQEEYYYDYVFHMDRLRELFHADVVKRLADEEKALADTRRLAMAASPLLLVGKAEVLKCMDELPGCINVVVLFDGPDHTSMLSDAFVQRLRESKCVIHRVPATTDATREFVKQFGAVFAHKRY